MKPEEIKVKISELQQMEINAVIELNRIKNELEYYKTLLQNGKKQIKKPTLPLPKRIGSLKNISK